MRLSKFILKNNEDLFIKIKKISTNTLNTSKWLLITHKMCVEELHPNIAKFRFIIIDYAITHSTIISSYPHEISSTT